MTSLHPAEALGSRAEMGAEIQAEGPRESGRCPRRGLEVKEVGPGPKGVCVW